MTGGNLGLGMIVFLVVLVPAFDVMNGFHDAANSMATIVSTRPPRPHFAAACAAFISALAYWFAHRLL